MTLSHSMTSSFLLSSSIYSHLFPLTMSPNSNLHVHNVHTLRLPPPIIPCLAADCNHHFYNRSGHSSYIWSQHPELLQNARQPRVPPMLGSSPHNSPSPWVISQSTSSSPAPDPIPAHSTGGMGFEEDEDSDGDIDMTFDPVETLFINDESDSRLKHESSASSSWHISLQYSDDGTQDRVVLPGINKLYHPNINGELFNTIFIRVSYVYCFALLRENLQWGWGLHTPRYSTHSMPIRSWTWWLDAI